MKNHDLHQMWPEVRRVFASNLGALIASVNEDGSPHVTPIGSLTLRGDCTGYYAERFPVRLPRNIERDARICVYVCENGMISWFRSLMRGRFKRPIAFRLVGRAAESRPLTEEERKRFLRRVRIFRWTPGHDLQWGDLQYARELIFDSYVPVRFGRMTAGLYP